MCRNNFLVDTAVIWGLTVVASLTKVGRLTHLPNPELCYARLLRSRLEWQSSHSPRWSDSITAVDSLMRSNQVGLELNLTSLDLLIRKILVVLCLWWVAQWTTRSYDSFPYFTIAPSRHGLIPSLEIIVSWIPFDTGVYGLMKSRQKTGMK